MGTKASEKPPPLPAVCTLKALAGALGMTPQRLSQMKADGFPEPESRGRYNRDECLRWMVSHWKDRALAAEAGRARPARTRGAVPAPDDRPSPGIDQEEAKRRKWLAEAHMAELKVAQARGELVPATEIMDAVSPLVSLVRQGLQGLPARLGVRLHGCKDPAEAEEILREALHKALQTIAEAPARALRAGGAAEED